jgi:hypothetical protein
MTVETYVRVRDDVIRAGYAHEIEWAQAVGPPTDAWAFFCEYEWVVLNSGMRNQVAVIIRERVHAALERGLPVSSAFRHPGKAAAIQAVHDDRERWLARYLGADDKLAFCKSMPWIGLITCWHLAKNLGVDCAKPDRHLTRLAERYATTPHDLCAGLASATGDRVGTVDLVLWRAANLGLVDEPRSLPRVESK